MCSLFALWKCTFLQNFITLCCLVFELRDLEEEEEEEKEEKEEEEEEKKMNKTLYHSPIYASMMLGTMPIPIY